MDTTTEDMATFKASVRAIATLRDEKSELGTRLQAINKLERQHMKIVIPFMIKNNLTEVRLQSPYHGRILLEEKKGRKGLTQDHVAMLAREVVDESRAERLAKRIFEDRKETTRYVLQRLRDSEGGSS
jgi:hypothetical protein